MQPIINTTSQVESQYSKEKVGGKLDPLKELLVATKEKMEWFRAEKKGWWQKGMVGG